MSDWISNIFSFFQSNIGFLILIVLLFIGFKIQRIYEIIYEIGMYAEKIHGRISRGDIDE